MTFKVGEKYKIVRESFADFCEVEVGTVVEISHVHNGVAWSNQISYLGILGSSRAVKREPITGLLTCSVGWPFAVKEQIETGQIVKVQEDN